MTNWRKSSKRETWDFVKIAPFPQTDGNYVPPKHTTSSQSYPPNFYISTNSPNSNPRLQHSFNWTWHNQASPTMQNKKAHISETVGKCSNRWLTDSPSDLHKQHQSTITKPLLWRLFVVKILPMAASQTK